MSDRDDGGPAFPQAIVGNDPLLHMDLETQKVTLVGSGMTLRDYFAGQALGIAYEVWKFHEDPLKRGEKVVATIAFEIADLMLAARKRP